MCIENKIINTDTENYSNNFNSFNVIRKSVLERNARTCKKNDNFRTDALCSTLFYSKFFQVNV